MPNILNRILLAINPINRNISNLLKSQVTKSFKWPIYE